MGSWTSNFCKPNGKGQEYIKRLEATIELITPNVREKQLLLDHRGKLVDMVDDAEPVKVQLGGIWAKIVISPPLYRRQNELPLSQEQPKLILELDADHGYIVIPQACYFGCIKNNQAHGEGSVFIPGFEVEGQWENDSFLSGKIIKHTPQLNGPIPTLLKTTYCQLVLVNLERFAILKTEEFEYSGEITLKRAKSINDLLTGQGTIVYKSGDKYTGNLVKGIFESANRVATYTYGKGDPKEPVQIVSFKGCYQNGLRKDRGIFQIKIEDNIFLMSVRYSKGIPVGKGQVSNSNYGSIQFDVTEDGVVLGSRIMTSRIVEE